MFSPLQIEIGAPGKEPRLIVEVLDYQHPERAEPANLDLLQCRITAHAPPVEATFEIPIGLWELLEVRDYLRRIGTGNGPSQSFMLAGGLLTLSFAPSRRGPVLCAVLLKTIDASHVRLEYMITLEPEDISRTVFAMSPLSL
ncbi:MAG TPA: hypothetical protein VFA29_12965 [Candidatus Baltobacteraceae bacterium]|nr:hypothetical protein [Candidatus Baltobacteraceae bacterium]